MRKIVLSTKEELKIYMSPVRQQLLRQLNLSNLPMTPKMLADRLKISPSAVQHHIKKLMELEIVELDHTEMINGITARFYKAVQVTVQVGLGQADGLGELREVLVQETISQVYQGFCSNMKKKADAWQNGDPGFLREQGDILSGVVHLNKQESDELMNIINRFIEEHSTPGADSRPWEFAVIAYNAEEIEHE